MKKIAFKCDKCGELVIISEPDIHSFIASVNEIPITHFCPKGGHGALQEIATVTVEPKPKCWGC